MSIIHRIIPKLNMINGWERSEDLWPREIKPIMRWKMRESRNTLQIGINFFRFHHSPSQAYFYHSHRWVRFVLVSLYLWMIMICCDIILGITSSTTATSSQQPANEGKYNNFNLFASSDKSRSPLSFAISSSDTKHVQLFITGERWRHCLSPFQTHFAIKSYFWMDDETNKHMSLDRLKLMRNEIKFRGF